MAVITSYSIHYTKLYEEDGVSWLAGDPRVSVLQRPLSRPAIPEIVGEDFGVVECDRGGEILFSEETSLRGVIPPAGFPSAFPI